MFFGIIEFMEVELVEVYVEGGVIYESIVIKIDIYFDKKVVKVEELVIIYMILKSDI